MTNILLMYQRKKINHIKFGKPYVLFLIVDLKKNIDSGFEILDFL